MNCRRQALQLCLDSAVVVVVQIVDQFSLEVFHGFKILQILYSSVPVWVGTLVVGVVSAIAACFDLRKVIDSLGFLGVVIIVSIVCIGIYALITSGKTPVEASANMLRYVEEGKILQAGVFGIHHSMPMSTVTSMSIPIPTPTRAWTALPASSGII